MRVLILTLLLCACSKDSNSTTVEETTDVGGECVYGESFKATVYPSQDELENGRFFRVDDQDGKQIYRISMGFEGLTPGCIDAVKAAGEFELTVKQIVTGTCNPVNIDEEQLMKAFGCENKQADASGAIKALQSFDDSYIQEGLESELYYY